MVGRTIGRAKILLTTGPGESRRWSRSQSRRRRTKESRSLCQRVEEELERRRDEIEAEVLRHMEEVKKIMEALMMRELQKRKQEQLKEAQRKEVRSSILAKAFHYIILYTHHTCFERIQLNF